MTAVLRDPAAPSTTIPGTTQSVPPIGLVPPPGGGGRAPLMRALPWLDDRGEAVARLSLVLAGLLPVTLIATTAFGVAGLRVLAERLLAPVIAVELVVLTRHARTAGLVAAALVAGMLSTALYDLFRFQFLWLGLMHRDPIPHIGSALHLRPAWVFGYLWRYLGNGGGLAITFFALGLRGVRAGVAYGLLVCSGLLATLILAPYGQQMLFPLNGVTVVMATGGHMIYGGVLGALAQRIHGRVH